MSTPVPNGKGLSAMRIALGSNGTPLAVGRPAERRPYQEATPLAR